MLVLVSDSFHEEQVRDIALYPIMNYLSEGALPELMPNWQQS